MLCKEHRKHFTIYPPGYFPYARRKAINVDTQGLRVVPDEVEAAELLGARDNWEASIGQAVIDAWQGLIWPRLQNPEYPATYWTQRRDVQWAAGWMGLSSANDDVCSAVKSEMGIATLVYRDSQRAWNSATTLTRRASAVANLLRQAAPLQSMLEAVYRTGTVTGVWGIVQMGKRILRPP